MVTGIEHVAIYANDSKALSSWYVDMFDGKIVYDNGKGTYFVALNDKSMIEFCQNASVKNVMTELETPGIRHIAFSVDNFDAQVEKIKNSNAKILKDAFVTEKGIGTIFFADPEGNILHLISRPSPLV